MKRLVVCLDGTWNTPDEGDNPTNAVKIMRALLYHDDNSIPQIAFYDKGIGTGGPLDRVRGGAMGRGLDDNVKDGYRFLANNYEQDDEIYLFGFSRGAFTVRSLAGFIGWVGLLKKGEMRLLPEAWRTYREEDKKGRDSLEEYSRKGVRVKCVGVWDTVGALGIPSKLATRFTQKKYRFHDTSPGSHIDHAFHALAIDEQRGPFEPTLWECPENENINITKVQQVWFAGVHSNVGGSYPDAGLSDITLDWMIKQVELATDLAFETEYKKAHIQPNSMGTHHNSLGWYVYSRTLPFQRVIGQNNIQRSWLSKRLRRTHRPKPGYKYVNEMIHHTALERLGKNVPFRSGKKESLEIYYPENLLQARGKLPVVKDDGSIDESGQIQ